MQIQTTFCKEYLIELQKDSAFYKSFDFYVSEVIDGRINKENIGFVSDGFNESAYPIEFKYDIRYAFKNYIDNLLVCDNYCEPIKIKIKEISVSSEYMVVSEEGTSKLVMEYYNSEGDLIYMTNYQVDLPSIDAVLKHEKAIRYLIQKSLLVFSLYDRKSNLYFDLLNCQNLQDTIILADSLKKGFYANFYELQANNPSIQIDFELRKYMKNGKQYSEVSFDDPMFNANKLYDMIYGFSDGKKVYIKSKTNNRGYTFKPVDVLGKYTYVGKMYDNQAIPIILPFVFGLVTVPIEQDYILSLSSGKIYPLNEETMNLILAVDKKLLDAYQNQPFERREKMRSFWLEQYNNRYKENLKK